MNKKYKVIRSSTMGVVEDNVNKQLAEGAELVGGPFVFVGLLCQAMLMPVEEETEHEDSN